MKYRTARPSTRASLSRWSPTGPTRSSRAWWSAAGGATGGRSSSSVARAGRSWLQRWQSGGCRCRGCKRLRRRRRDDVAVKLCLHVSIARVHSQLAPCAQGLEPVARHQQERVEPRREVLALRRRGPGDPRGADAASTPPHAIAATLTVARRRRSSSSSSGRRSRSGARARRSGAPRASTTSRAASAARSEYIAPILYHAAPRVIAYGTPTTPPGRTETILMEPAAAATAAAARGYSDSARRASRRRSGPSTGTSARPRRPRRRRRRGAGGSRALSLMMKRPRASRIIFR